VEYTLENPWRLADLGRRGKDEKGANMTTVSCRTNGMLKSVLNHNAHFERFRDTSDELRAEIAAYLKGPAPEPLLAISHGNTLRLRAHANCTTIKQTDRIDWATWSLALHYTELAHRCARRGGPPRLNGQGWVTLSGYLWAALAHDLMGNRTLAQLYLAALLRPIVPVVDYMKLGRAKTPIEAGVIGFAFHTILGAVPDHPAFARWDIPLTPEGLAQAALDRKTYAKASNPAGSMLSGPEGDLVPVELMILNRALPEADQDPDLRAFAAHLAAATYPDDAVYQSLDAMVTVAGY